MRYRSIPNATPIGTVTNETAGIQPGSGQAYHQMPKPATTATKANGKAVTMPDSGNAPKRIRRGSNRAISAPVATGPAVGVPAYPKLSERTGRRAQGIVTMAETSR